MVSDTDYGAVPRPSPRIPRSSTPAYRSNDTWTTARADDRHSGRQRRRPERWARFCRRDDPGAATRWFPGAEPPTVPNVRSPYMVKTILVDEDDDGCRTGVYLYWPDAAAYDTGSPNEREEMVGTRPDQRRARARGAVAPASGSSCRSRRSSSASRPWLAGVLRRPGSDGS